MLRVWAVLGVLGTFAGCAPSEGGDAGPLDARDTAMGCPIQPLGRSGTCATDGERICTGGPGAGCRCISGCWLCTPDECWMTDRGGPGLDAGVPDDDAGHDDAAMFDAPAEDASGEAPLDAGSAPDAGTPAEMTYCIDIFVSNTCEMTVEPEEITIPADQTAYFCWRNTSDDYPVDVWLSYGGGYTDLAPGSTWNEPPGHCLGPTPHDEYADISTACSEHRFLIHCL